MFIFVVVFMDYASRLPIPDRLQVGASRPHGVIILVLTVCKSVLVVFTVS